MQISRHSITVPMSKQVDGDWIKLSLKQRYRTSSPQRTSTESKGVDASFGTKNGSVAPHGGRDHGCNDRHVNVMGVVIGDKLGGDTQRLEPLFGLGSMHHELPDGRFNGAAKAVTAKSAGNDDSFIAIFLRGEREILAA